MFNTHNSLASYYQKMKTQLEAVRARNRKEKEKKKGTELVSWNRLLPVPGAHQTDNNLFLPSFPSSVWKQNHIIPNTGKSLNNVNRSLCFGYHYVFMDQTFVANTGINDSKPISHAITGKHCRSEIDNIAHPTNNGKSVINTSTISRKRMKQCDTNNSIATKQGNSLDTLNQVLQQFQYRNDFINSNVSLNKVASSIAQSNRHFYECYSNPIPRDRGGRVKRYPKMKKKKKRIIICSNNQKQNIKSSRKWCPKLETIHEDVAFHKQNKQKQQKHPIITTSQTMNKENNNKNLLLIKKNKYSPLSSSHSLQKENNSDNINQLPLKILQSLSSLNSTIIPTDEKHKHNMNKIIEHMLPTSAFSNLCSNISTTATTKIAQ